MEPSCCTEFKTTTVPHSWTIKNFSSVRASMILRSTVFYGESCHTSQKFSWYYQLNPQKLKQNYYYVAIEAIADYADKTPTSVFAEIAIDFNNANVTNLNCSGAVQSNSRIGQEMMVSYVSVTSYLLQNHALTLRFKMTLNEEFRNGFPAMQQPNLQPDDLLGVQFGSLLASTKFSDVTLVIGEKQFPAHKAILAARSKVFAAMFEHEMQESTQNIVEIKDVTLEVFQEMLHFIYTGTVQKIELADELLKVADMYELGSLKKRCENHLVTKLSVESVTSTLRLADMYNATQLKQQSISFISKHLKEMPVADWRSVLETSVDVAAEMIADIVKENCNLDKK